MTRPHLRVIVLAVFAVITAFAAYHERGLATRAFLEAVGGPGGRGILAFSVMDAASDRVAR